VGFNEWNEQSWKNFHQSIVNWSNLANIANTATDKSIAISAWQALLGNNYFPQY
jgi:hypothetical protein